MATIAVISEKLYQFSLINFKYHLLIGFFIRTLFLIYGIYQDAVSIVMYTDVDYKVFTDASNHMLNNRSPYLRQTYRYPPLLALLLIPNLTLHHTFGKVLFCVFDILVAVMIREIVKNNLFEYEFMRKSEISNVNILPKSVTNRENLQNPHFNSKAILCMLLWLYNPMAIVISTRGNCDAIPTFLVLLTLYFLQNKKMNFVSGCIHGLSVYMRLYPLIYSIAIYVFLSDISLYSIIYSSPIKNILKIPTNSTFYTTKNMLYLLPNVKQFKLITGFLMTLCTLMGISYYLYGYEFLYETYLYHAIRKDVRHNFSLYFYLQYLADSINYQSVWLKLLTVLPQLVLLITFSVKYGLNKFCLNFSILVQTIVFVTFNSVFTSQYFIWVMGILPLCVLQIRIPFKTVVYVTSSWIISQVVWLLFAYCLEFKGQNTFFFIWIQCVSFFCVNVAILGRLIKYFMCDVK